MPARRAAPATAFCTDASLTGCRRTSPVRESVDSGEYPLPPPRPVGVGILHGQRVGQPDPSEARGQVAVVQRLGPHHLLLQRQDQVLGQHRDRSLPPLPSRTRISRRSAPTSLTRRRRASSKRMPVPYMGKTDGPFAEAKEIFGGYWSIVASTSKKRQPLPPRTRALPVASRTRSTLSSSNEPALIE